MRRTTFATHKGLIEEHNASNGTYQMAINKFADWTQVKVQICLNSCVAYGPSKLLPYLLGVCVNSHIYTGPNLL